MEEKSNHSAESDLTADASTSEVFSVVSDLELPDAAGDEQRALAGLGSALESGRESAIEPNAASGIKPDSEPTLAPEPNEESEPESEPAPKRESSHPLTVRSEPPADDISSLGTPARRLEAVLFLAKEPWNTRRLAQYAQLEDGSEVRRLIGELNASYRAKCYSFRILGVAGGYQLMARPQFGEWLRHIHKKHAVQMNLSPTALETLAIIAYKQPVLRVDIEAIRGFQCGEMLHSLMERDLVRIVARSDDLGRPYLYGTTKKFLAVYGLNSLDDLPKQKFSKNLEQSDISAKAPNTEPAIKNPMSVEENDLSTNSKNISTNCTDCDSGESMVDNSRNQMVLQSFSDTTETIPQEESQMLHKMNDRSVFGENKSADFSDVYSPYQDSETSTAVLDSDDEDNDDDKDDKDDKDDEKEDDDWDDDDEDDDDDWDEDDEEWEDEEEDDEDWEDDDEWEVVEDDDEDWDDEDDEDEDDEDWDDDDDWGDDDEDDENN